MATLIQKIIDLKKEEREDWWNELSDAEKESIKDGISDADHRNLKPNADAEKIYAKWL